jgi:hypothetical protein
VASLDAKPLGGLDDVRASRVTHAIALGGGDTRQAEHFRSSNASRRRRRDTRRCLDEGREVACRQLGTYANARAHQVADKPSNLRARQASWHQIGATGEPRS